MEKRAKLSAVSCGQIGKKIATLQIWRMLKLKSHRPPRARGLSSPVSFVFIADVRAVSFWMGARGFSAENPPRGNDSPRRIKTRAAKLCVIVSVVSSQILASLGQNAAARL